jgi:hypothetical protein
VDISLFIEASVEHFRDGPRNGLLFVLMTFFLKGLDGFQGTVEGAIVGVLIAVHQSQKLFIVGFVGEKGLLGEADGALLEPVEFGEVVDEGGFDVSLGIEVLLESCDELVEIGRVFAGHDDSFAGQAVIQGVLAADGTSRFCTWAAVFVVRFFGHESMEVSRAKRSMGELGWMVEVVDSIED